MIYDFYEKNFRIKASNAGYSEEEIQKCLKYARHLIENNLPIIYNTHNLAALVGYNKYYLKKAALFTTYFYREFTIKKHSGKLRKLKEPLPSLKEIQIWILDNILYQVPVSRFAKAYVPKRTLIDNVRFHRNKNKIVALDIQDFFSSISRTYVEHIFCEIGYSSNISNLLSKLCCCDEVLPQGAPTSPYLSNIYLRTFDKHVSDFCITNKIRYTRYADDLTFSGDFDEISLIFFIKQELTMVSLNLNESKIKVMTQNNRQIVTGIVVNEVIQIPKNERKFIRQEVYYLKKFGLLNHLIKTNNSRANYIKHLLGKLSYAIYINPKDNEMLEYKTFLIETFMRKSNDYKL